MTRLPHNRRNLSRMEDSDTPQWDTYRLLITRDGSGWRATADGPGLPGHGRFITGKTVAALNARTHELFCDLPEYTCWRREYENAASPVTLHEWSMSKLKASQVNARNDKDGHALALALAADGASVSDIAEVTHGSYLEAAWMLAVQPPPHRVLAGTRTIRADQRRYYRSGVTRMLRIIAADKARRLTAPLILGHGWFQ
jgi:hypothetical protein